MKLTKKTLLIVIILLMIAFIILYECGNNNNAKYKVNDMTKTIIAKENTYENTLYYNGSILPNAKISVNAPADGVVDAMYFKYGDRVDAKQKLFVIKSEKSRIEFQASLNTYIKAKQNLDDSKSKMEVTEKLYKLEIESKNNYEDAKNKYLTDQLSFIDAKNNLSKVLKAYGISVFPEVSTKDINSIQKTMDYLKNKMESIEVYSPKSGITLFPKDNGNEEDNISAGSQVKEAQTLVNIGDNFGIIVKILVDEIDINNIHVAEDAIVIGDAFANSVLQGKVNEVASQATMQGTQPYFVVTIVVPRLTSEQKKNIHFGMSARVAISIKNNPKILVPLNALKREMNKTYLNVINKKTGKLESVAVIVGETTTDSAVITSGIKAGDKIVISN